MEVNNPLYKNQGIDTISCLFTVEKGVTKVLLIKRDNAPFKGMRALVGGALYNNEELLEGAKREIKRETGIENIELSMCNTFSKVDRSPVMRMIAVSYLGVIDAGKVKVLKKTLKTIDADWFPIDNIPKLAYDHNEILNDALEKLKIAIINSEFQNRYFQTVLQFQKFKKHMSLF
ncbi:MAG: NUDIX domain-containing protein [Bacilli bacterium]